MVSLCRRNYAAHTRDEIFEALGDVIGDRWKVDLKNPDHVILMEAIKVRRRRRRDGRKLSWMPEYKTCIFDPHPFFDFFSSAHPTII